MVDSQIKDIRLSQGWSDVPVIASQSSTTVRETLNALAVPSMEHDDCSGRVLTGRIIDSPRGGERDIVFPLSRNELNIP